MKLFYLLMIPFGFHLLFSNLTSTDFEKKLLPDNYIINLSSPCLPGDITLTTQQEVDDFVADYGGCTEIQGNLVIGPSTDIVNLDGLLGVTEITAGLLIKNNMALTDIDGLGNLTEAGVGGIGITINDNILLPAIDLSNLTNSSYATIYIYNNAALTSLNLTTNIQTTGDLSIQLNPLITSLPSFNNLTTINGRLILADIASGSLPNFPLLTSIGNQLFIQNCPDITSANIFPSLDILGNGLTIYNNPNLESIPNFNNLTAINGGPIDIQNNDMLPDFDLSLVSAPNLSFVSVYQNDILNNFCLPSNLSTTIGNFSIQANPLLNDFCSNTSLISVGGWLAITETLDADLPDYTNLQTIENGIYIRNNLNIDHLPDFDNLTTLSGGPIDIQNNDMLPSFDLSLVSAPNLSYVIVHQNDILNNFCLPSNLSTTIGNFSIQSNPLLNDFCATNSLTSVGGWLAITETLDTDLPDYPNLQTIENGIYIRNNPNIDHLPSFDNLATLSGGPIDIQNNDLLPNIDLASVSAPNLSHVEIYGNEILTNLCLPSNLSSTSNFFRISLNPILSDICSNDALSSIGGWLYISNTQDTNLPNYPALTTVGNGIYIFNNNLISQLPTFDNLNTILGGALFFSENPLLTEIDLSAVSAPNLSDVYIFNHQSLTTLLLPNDITTISNRFEIESNPQLTTISNFNALQTVNTFLEISSNAICEIPEFQSLTSIGQASNQSTGLFFIGNPNITKLYDFPSLTSLDSALLILNNPLLTDCAIQAVCDFLPSTKFRNISNNAGDCLDEAALQNHCENGPTILEPAFPDDMLVTTGTSINLSITNLPANYEAIWYDDDMTTILYQDAANSFDYTVNETTTLYGTYAPSGTSCTSELEPLLLTAKAPATPASLTLNVHYTASQCADVGSGTASVFTRGGAQAIGTGRFSGMPQPEFPQWGNRAKSADLNGDGYIDITAGEGGRPITIWLNNGDGTFSESFQFDHPYFGGNSSAHDIGDLDGDGDLDIFTNTENSHLVVLFNDGNANFTAGPDFHFGRAKYAIELGDLDGDGDLDALEIGLGGNSSTHELRPFLMMEMASLLRVLFFILPLPILVIVIWFLRT